MPTTTTPAEILIPAAGAPTVRGVALTVRRLEAFGPDQAARPHVLHYDLVRGAAKRAIADGHVLCLRPMADRPACVGLTATHFADASLQPDFAVRALVVDPHDADGNDLRDVPVDECLGHPAGTAGVMGQTTYCDGSCARARRLALAAPMSERATKAWARHDAKMTPEEAHAVAV